MCVAVRVGGGWRSPPQWIGVEGIPSTHTGHEAQHLLPLGVREAGAGPTLPGPFLLTLPPPDPVGNWSPIPVFSHFFLGKPPLSQGQNYMGILGARKRLINFWAVFR